MANRMRRQNEKKRLKFRKAAFLLLSFLLSYFAASPQTAQPDKAKNSEVDILSPLPPKDKKIFQKDVLPAVILQIEKSWWPIIPESARPPQSKQGEVAISFLLHSDGKISDMKLDEQSGDIALDHAAWGGVTGAIPFRPFPTKMSVQEVRLRLHFLYNIRPN